MTCAGIVADIVVRETWGNVPDCLLSWESMWEARPGFLGSAGPGSIELDIAVIDGTSKRGKGYQMGTILI